ncbi:hypothetical protein OSCI_3370010 [Kamptonema sp. PCC 6506]|nr:hypothetical protein OSCI_3370010 [Kamptonema sp. PCC 6506]
MVTEIQNLLTDVHRLLYLYFSAKTSIDIFRPIPSSLFPLPYPLAPSYDRPTPHPPGIIRSHPRNW